MAAMVRINRKILVFPSEFTLLNPRYPFTIDKMQTVATGMSELDDTATNEFDLRYNTSTSMSALTPEKITII